MVRTERARPPLRVRLRTGRNARRSARAGSLALVLAAATAAWHCGGGPSTPVRPAAQRVFVIGFDGMDPTLARRWMDEGRLPNLKKLADEGTFATLGTTQPSESPTAWSSFATGVNPGKHNIYDFLIRHTDTYAPDFNMVRKEPPAFLWNYIPTRRPRVVSTRGGTSFWVHAGAAGIRTKVITVPVTFPPEPIEHGEMLAGLPLPDLRGTLGTYGYWATDVSRFEEGDSVFAGIIRRLQFTGDVAATALTGPPNPIVRQQIAALNADGPVTDANRATLAELQTREDVKIPMTVRRDPAARAVTIDLDGQTVRLTQGQWSHWIPVNFRINMLITIRGMMQFYLKQAAPEVQIYGSPINMDPRDPPIPISTPAGYAADLAKTLGVYRTLGWAESADKALNENRIDEATFLYDSNRAMDDRERLIFQALEDDDWDLFVAAIETTDRIQHMMWRLIDPAHPMYDPELAAEYGDAILKVYERADDLVGRLRARVPPDALFIVMSDHGFHSFRRSVNLNTWLVQHGYMAFSGQEGGEKTLADLFGRGQYFEGVDWSRTKAYAVGLGQIYFNLRGREGQGIVSSGAEYTALQQEIRSKLLQLTDEENGQPVFRDIYLRDDIYHGEFLGNAPDLEVGFNDGYRVGWQDTLGVIERAVIQDNDKKWSGDHCATATEISGGVLFINRRLATAAPNIMDLAPTVLQALGVALPGDLDGKPLK